MKKNPATSKPTFAWKARQTELVPNWYINKSVTVEI